MKFLKVLGMIVLACIVLFFAVGTFLPKTAVLEKDYTIAAPAGRVQDAVLDLYDSHLWPIWNTEDTTTRFTPLPGGNGYRWEGSSVAFGECVYSVGVDNSIWDHISFRGQDMAETLWRFDGDDPVKLRVTFTVNAGRNLSARWTNLFLETMMGSEIDHLVAGIKAKLENDGLKN